MAASSVTENKQKRQREKCSEDDENVHKRACEENVHKRACEENAHKRSCDDVLSDLFSTDDDNGDVDAAEDYLVLHVLKSFQEEISGVSDKGKYGRMKSDVGETVSVYEDLVNATDDQLGIEENEDAAGISANFWNDLFQNPPNSTGGCVDGLHPFLSHCYSYNNRGYMDCYPLLISEDQQEWMKEIFPALASQSFPNCL